jgi:hypothetical protein
MTAHQPVTRHELAAVRTTEALSNLLHRTGFPIDSFVAHTDDAGVHLGACPDRDRTNRHTIFDVIWYPAQPVTFAPCCATLPLPDLVNSLGGDAVGAAATFHHAIEAVLDNGPDNSLTLVTAVRILNRYRDTLGPAYPWIAEIVSELVDSGLGDEHDSENPTTLIVAYTNILLPGISRRTQLLACRSQLTYPGSHPIFLLDDIAAAEVEQQPNSSIRTVIFHADTAAAAHTAARTLRTLLDDAAPTTVPSRFDTVIDDIAATVDALHPDVHLHTPVEQDTPR